MSISDSRRSGKIKCKHCGKTRRTSSRSMFRLEREQRDKDDPKQT